MHNPFEEFLSAVVKDKDDLKLIQRLLQEDDDDKALRTIVLDAEGK